MLIVNQKCVKRVKAAMSSIFGENRADDAGGG
jgi:hypothetical protein